MSFRSLVSFAALVLAACDVNAPPPAPASILLIAGKGASPGDVAALRELMSAGHLDYAAASSQQIDKMSPTDLAAYKLIIMPGGNFEVMGNNLSKGATEKIRDAVHGGVNYL